METPPLPAQPIVVEPAPEPQVAEPEPGDGGPVAHPGRPALRLPDRVLQPAGERQISRPVDGSNSVAPEPKIASVPQAESAPDPVAVPHDLEPEKPSNVVPFAPKTTESVSSLKARNKPGCATRGTSTVSTRGTKKGATRGTSAGRWQVDSVKASKNTWAFRVRWTVGRERGTPAYVTRVSDSVYRKIRKDRRVYEQYKRQIISIHESGSLRASN